MRFFILCLDALESKIIQTLIKKNKLPNFKKLAEEGTYSLLQTVDPPQSPVAWASFITGKKPKDHGVLDFVVRNPQSYLPRSVYSVQKPLRLKNPFWEKIDLKHTPLTILFLPNTFPAPKLKGKIISGMGTPDIHGRMGSAILYSTSKKPITSEIEVVKKIVPLVNKKENKTYIFGPRYQGINLKIKESRIPLLIRREGKGILLIINNKKEIFLKPGEFSDYLELNFKLPLFKTISSLGVFYLKSATPEVTLYLLPLNIHPKRQVFKISYPKDYAAKLVDKIGFFTTLGMPYDSKAYEQGIYSQQSFLKQVDKIFQERVKILFQELEDFKKGTFIFYESVVDIIQHMFWGQREIVCRFYTKMDQLIGEVFKYLDKDNYLIVLSDHGFAPFDYQVNLNNLLKEKGYLQGEGVEIDWKETEAYALGFNSIYVNLKGRESQGVVEPSKRKDFLEELKLALLKEEYIAKVEVIDDDKPLRFLNYPDMIVGFKPPYRASWKTAVGALGKDIIERRKSKWTGDHLFEKKFVPGVFFSNKKVRMLKDFSIEKVINFIAENF